MKTRIAQVFILAMLMACNEEGRREKPAVSKVAVKSDYQFTAPATSGNFYLNDSIPIAIGPASAEVTAPDSAIVSVDGEVIGTIDAVNKQISWNSAGKGVGLHRIKAEVYAGGKVEKLSRNVILFSDEAPEDYTYKIIKKYPHDDQAFTQGLVYADGELYEGTGQKGSSELRRVELTTGEVLQRKPLNSSLFGEGITYYRDHLYQLTWQAGLGLVYDKNTFEEVSRFSYQDEGWGLTNNDEALIMSDGSNKLRFLDPGDFRLLKEIKVYDHNGAIGYINELEWIDGKVYANIWQKDLIVIIDPGSGKVTGKINMAGLFPADRQKPDVLNGIAYDAEKGRIFVTGKYWPVLFEIEVVKKNAISSS